MPETPKTRQEAATAAEWLEINIGLVKYTVNQYVTPFQSLNSRFEGWHEGALQNLFEEVLQDASLFVLERERHHKPEILDFGNYCYTMLRYGCRSSITKRFTNSPSEVKIPLELEYEPDYDAETDAVAVRRAIEALSPRKRLVLMGYLSGERGFLSNFARSEGISPQRASQIRDEAIEDIKTAFSL